MFRISAKKFHLLKARPVFYPNWTNTVRKDKVSSVTILGDLLDFGQLLKAFGNI